MSTHALVALALLVSPTAGMADAKPAPATGPVWQETPYPLTGLFKAMTDPGLVDVDAAALIPVVTGKQPLFVHVERAAGIRGVLALQLVSVGAGEGWRVAGEIAQAKVAIGGFYETDQPRYPPQFAGNVVGLSRVPGAAGLSGVQALAVMTASPADILGKGTAFGGLKPGFAENVVIWDGDPLEVASASVAMYTGSQLQSLVNHQSRLHQRISAFHRRGATQDVRMILRSPRWIQQER